MDCRRPSGRGRQSAIGKPGQPQPVVGCGLKRRHRLADAEQFRQVRQSGTSYSHPLLVLVTLANEGDVSRSGFTVSRRVGKAVERNRARRRMREAVRQIWDLVEPGWDLVWIARPGINEASFSELQTAVARLLGRARLLRAVSVE